MNTFNGFFVFIFVGIIVGFVAFACYIGWAIFHTISLNTANRNSPLVTVEATISTKRTNVSGSSDGPTSTSYYCTFELPDGERREIQVKGGEYGLLAEGDRGTLSYQGTWFKGFQRAGTPTPER